MPRQCKAELIFAVKHCQTKNKLAARRAIARRERKKFNKIAQNRGFCAKVETQCPKRARRAVRGLHERGICVDEIAEHGSGDTPPTERCAPPRKFFRGGAV